MKKKITILIFFLLFFIFLGSIFHQFSIAKGYGEDEKLILVGLGAYNDQFYDIAEKHFLQFVKDYPEHEKIYEVYFLLGKILLINGKPKEAKSILLKIIRENKNLENMEYILFWLAQIEIKLGNSEEGKRIYLSIQKKYPKFEWVDYTHYIIGLLDFGMNLFPEAEASFKKVVQSSKKKELILPSSLWLGILAYKQKDYETAIRYFNGIREGSYQVSKEFLKHTLHWLSETQIKLGKFQEAKLNYIQLVEDFKKDFYLPDIYWRVAFCEYQLGNIQDAIEKFKSFQNRFNDSKYILNTHYLLGDIYHFQGDFTSSIKEFNFILNHTQENRLWGVALVQLFWNYIHLGELEEANKIFQKLLKLNQFEDEKRLIQWLNAELIFQEGKILDSLPYFFNIVNTPFRERALFQIGKGYFFENKYREAITNIDILFLEFPNSKYTEESLFLKGESLVKMGNVDQALESFHLILKQNNSNFWRLLTLTEMGSIYLFRNETNKAERVLKSVLDNFSNHPLYYHAAFQLGNIQFKKKFIMEAIFYYSIVLKGNIQELFGEANFRLGEVFYQQGKYEKAFNSFETAIRYLKETSISFSLSQMEIGNIQRRWGQYEEAKKSYRLILNHSKDEEIKKAVLGLLNLIESN